MFLNKPPNNIDKFLVEFAIAVPWTAGEFTGRDAVRAHVDSPSRKFDALDSLDVLPAREMLYAFVDKVSTHTGALGQSSGPHAVTFGSFD